MLLQSQSGVDNATIVGIIQLGLRIVASIVCSNKAEKLNRSKTTWGWCGFIFPVVSMIWIYCLKPNVVWQKNVDTNID